jgi:hypothetical protein
MESSLSIQWSELQARVGSFLGFGRGAKYGDQAWTDQIQFELDGIVASALRKFYHQALPEGQEVAYDWSFLRPTSQLTLTSGTSVVPLPGDCGAIEGPITILTTTRTSQPWRIEWRNNGQVRQMFSVTPQMTGPPMYVAEDVLKGTTATQGQQRQLLFFPQADQDYTLNLTYYVNPDYLNGAFPYAYGGSQHSETILEGCLAVAERRLDDAATVHAMEYEKCLQASISIDRRNKAQHLGVNGDRSDLQERGYRGGDNHWWAPAATYNGASFG